jgi:hypothetical protein
VHILSQASEYFFLFLEYRPKWNVFFKLRRYSGRSFLEGWNVKAKLFLTLAPPSTPYPTHSHTICFRRANWNLELTVARECEGKGKKGNLHLMN